MTDDEFKAEVAERNALKARAPAAMNEQQSAADRGRGSLSSRFASSAFVALSRLLRPCRAQIRYATGQNVVPVFEGWERNADGSFNMVFGYMNRNYEEEVDVPVGPGQRARARDRGVDQGQPTHFYPRRQQFVFKVRVPKDWGKKDLVWTLTSPRQDGEGVRVADARRGRSTSARISRIAAVPASSARKTIRRRSRVEGSAAADASPPAHRSRSTPSSSTTAVRPRGPSQSGSNARVEGPLTQAVVRLDRGVRLGVIWVVYRGDAKAVTFEPRKIPVVDGKASTKVTIQRAGHLRPARATPTMGSSSQRPT